MIDEPFFLFKPGKVNEEQLNDFIRKLLLWANNQNIIIISSVIDTTYQ
ncbi:hypothetical protein ORQ98_02920 [Spartinivicinus sp. A2-2]|uniref:Uncharacterized protein n=1 Tax=Spartinivicinus poritis TaxID=2994640 RepID=A0ABT5U3G4_9GAMM|nr:hypothetical protein [Spartinivicinus sp. A2-2]